MPDVHRRVLLFLQRVPVPPPGEDATVRKIIMFIVVIAFATAAMITSVPLIAEHRWYGWALLAVAAMSAGLALPRRRR